MMACWQKLVANKINNKIFWCLNKTYIFIIVLQFCNTKECPLQKLEPSWFWIRVYSPEISHDASSKWQFRSTQFGTQPQSLLSYSVPQCKIICSAVWIWVLTFWVHLLYTEWMCPQCDFGWNPDSELCGAEKCIFCYDMESNIIFNPITSGFGVLEDACWLLVPKFAGSNPAEAVGFFRAKKSPTRLPSEGK
jgi:hypothetical protein